jgi:transcriptional regulator with XRE-family HTH domain
MYEIKATNFNSSVQSTVSPECALLAVLALHIGTGGYATAIPLAQSTSVTISQRIDDHADQAYLGLLEKLVALRALFDLNMSDLARALHVQRPTAYAWMTGKSVPRVGHMDRIAMLLRLGQELRERIGTAASLLPYRFADGSSVAALLQRDIPDAELRIALNGVKVRVEAESVADLLSRHGFKARSKATQDRNLLQATL